MGCSCRNYAAAAEAIPGAIGLSGSTVSRRVHSGKRDENSAELQERDVSGEEVVALVLDGKTFAEATMVVALGITMTGNRTVPGLCRDGHRERAGVDPVPPVLGRAGPRFPRGFW